MSLYDDDDAELLAAPTSLGSLADELAGAFSSDLDSDASSETSSLRSHTPQPPSSTPATPTIPPADSPYSGSSYGDPEDLLETGLSFSLESKLSQLETLALLSRAADPDDPIPRLMSGLQTLQPQSVLETSSTRLITAHSALSSHMLHSTRTLRDLSYAITAGTLPAEDTEELLALLGENVPRAEPEALVELAALHAVTAGLVAQLSFLSDSLHMARQSSLVAGRKLRVAREACAEWKGELECAERAKRWIEDGDWDRRCRERRAEEVCREVMGGFAEVCGGLEERLKGGLVVGG